MDETTPKTMAEAAGMLRSILAFLSTGPLDSGSNPSAERADRHERRPLTPAERTRKWREKRVTASSQNVTETSHERHTASPNVTTDSPSRGLDSSVFSLNQANTEDKDKTNTSGGASPKRHTTSQSVTDRILWTPLLGWANIDDTDRAQFRAAYPAVDLDRQLAAADQWLKANPAKAKKSNWRRFLVNWLARAQERGGDVKSTKPVTDPRTSADAWASSTRTTW